jgi:hypothetical protein
MPRARRVCRRQTALKGLFNNNYISAERSYIFNHSVSLYSGLCESAMGRMRVNHLNAPHRSAFVIKMIPLPLTFASPIAQRGRSQGVALSLSLAAENG